MVPFSVPQKTSPQVLDPTMEYRSISTLRGLPDLLAEAKPTLARGRNLPRKLLLDRSLGAISGRSVRSRPARGKINRAFRATAAIAEEWPGIGLRSRSLEIRAGYLRLKKRRKYF